MNLLLIGSGAREHSFAWKIFNSKHHIKIFVTNPNAGISKISFSVDVDINDFASVKRVIIAHSIDIVLIGPEIPLINGISDFIQNDESNASQSFGLLTKQFVFRFFSKSLTC